mgnify:CR=1 FL=1
MNVKELIEKIEALPAENYIYRPWIDKKVVLGLVRQLDEPQKVVVPQFVADWIEYCKAREITLAHALYYPEEAKNKNVYRWLFEESVNQEKFAQAWIFGYTVEKEKQYIVKMKGLNEDNSYLNYDSIDDEWYFTDAENGPAVGIHHTRKELEEAGFGWVFDCEGIEIEEVE